MKKDLLFASGLAGIIGVIALAVAIFQKRTGSDCD